MVNATPFRPTMAMRSAPRVRPIPAAMMARTVTPLANAVIGPVVFGGAVFGVIYYIRHVLMAENAAMNRAFSQQNSQEVVEHRNRRLLVSSEGDPKKSLYNILNW